MDRLKTVMTVQEVAAYLRLHEMTIYRMIQRGDLPALRVGRAWRFRKDQVDRWLATCEINTNADGARPRAAASPNSRGRGRAR